MSDSTLTLLDELCRIRGFRVDKGGPGEQAIARRVAQELGLFSWLTVVVEPVCDAAGNEMPGFYNVLAYSGDPSDIDLLIVGHLDTVAPSQGWTVKEFTSDHGRYYALGAIDARSGIACCLDAIGKVGATKGVGYLFYSDEEVFFSGMRDFVLRHPEIAPSFGLSVCGGPATAHVGWRGCTEMEFLVQGVSGHASRPFEGANAAEAISMIMEEVSRACMSEQTQMATSANVAAIHAGSADSDNFATFQLGRQVPPSVIDAANKIPNVGWALLDVRPGGPEVSASFIEQVAREVLGRFNAGRPHRAEMRVHVNFQMPMYMADERIDWMVELFDPVHGGARSDPGRTGFLDTGLISAAHGTQFMCLAPAGGNAHGPDEYVNIYSMLAYRDCIVDLLRRYRAD